MGASQGGSGKLETKGAPLGGGGGGNEKHTCGREAGQAVCSDGRAKGDKGGGGRRVGQAGEPVQSLGLTPLK